MKIHALWYGGDFYFIPDPIKDREKFNSIMSASNALYERFSSGGYWRQSFHYVNDEFNSVYTPDVTLCSYIKLYKPEDESPFAVIYLDKYDGETRKFFRFIKE